MAENTPPNGSPGGSALTDAEIERVERVDSPARELSSDSLRLGQQPVDDCEIAVRATPRQEEMYFTGDLLDIVFETESEQEIISTNPIPNTYLDTVDNVLDAMEIGLRYGKTIRFDSGSIKHVIKIASKRRAIDLRSNYKGGQLLEFWQEWARKNHPNIDTSTMKVYLDELVLQNIETYFSAHVLESRVYITYCAVNRMWLWSSDAEYWQHISHIIVRQGPNVGKRPMDKDVEHLRRLLQIKREQAMEKFKTKGCPICSTSHRQKHPLVSPDAPILLQQITIEITWTETTKNVLKDTARQSSHAPLLGPTSDACNAAAEISSLLHLAEKELHVEDILKIQICFDKGISGVAATYSVFEWLQGLLFLDYRTRDNRVVQLPKKQTPKDNFYQRQTAISSCINPLDQIALVFPFCSKRLQMLLARAMFLCRLAVPIVTPNFKYDTFNIHLEPLANIILDADTEGKPCKLSALDANTAIVSFVRFGKSDYASKSHTINYFLHKSEHPTFVHFHSNNGSQEKRVSAGLIEASWHLPTSSESQQPILTLLNLRGDVHDLMPHFAMLVNISTVVVCFYRHHPNQDLRDFVRNINCSKTVHYILVLAPNETEQLGSLLDFELTNISFIELSPSDKVDTTATRIHKTIAPILTQTSLHSRKIHEITMPDSPTMWRSDYSHKSAIFDAVQNIVGKMPFEIKQVRQDIFPLQGDLWMEYSSQQKGYFQKVQDKVKWEDKTEVESRVELDEALETIRERQKNLLSMISPPMTLCYDALHGYKKYGHPESGLLFLKTLNNAMAKKYNSMFGIEHIFRELGQIYESSQNDIHSKFQTQLPEIVANVVTGDCPFEILDGNTSNIALEWFQAVLNKIKNMIGEQKTVLVLSVLGIQSSGKSTLLNAMFGTQFAVGLGRCTKGVFMQLVKAHDGLIFDYVLVLDTEGLRAPELGSESINRDNELATFVIGASDVTIINIKGENYNEMKDVIQIVIQAFIRMGRVHDENKRCLFVHQNVQAAYAAKKPVEGSDIHRKLQTTLGDIKQEVCKSQQVDQDIDIFQLLKFDFDLDAFFFKDFWQGEAPMAYVNPEYSYEALKLRQRIYDVYSSYGKSQLKSLSYFIEYVVDLWRAILEENFVFSFRNCREIRIFNIMEKAYTKCLQHIQDEVDICEKKFVDGKITECGGSLAELKAGLDSLTVHCHDLDTSTKHFVGENFDKVCKFHEEATIMRQWFSDKGQVLERERSDLIRHCKYRGETEFENEISMYDARVQEKDYKDKMMAKALSIAGAQKITNEYELKNTFEEMWLSINKPQQPDSTSEPTSEIIIKKIERAMISVFGSDAHTAFSSLKKVEILNISKQTNMSELSDAKFLTVESFSARFSNPELKVDLDNLPKFRKIILHHIKTRVEPDIGRFLQSLKKSTRFKSSICFDLITRVKRLCECDTLAVHDLKATITLQRGFQTDMAALACKIAFPKFCELHTKLVIERRLSFRVKDYKDRLWGIFRDMTNKTDWEIIISKHIISRMDEILTQNLDKCINSEVRVYLRQNFIDKKLFLRNILESLAKQAQFDSYSKYFDDPESFARKWLNENTLAIRNSTICLKVCKRIASGFRECIHKLSSENVPSQYCDWEAQFWRKITSKLTLGTVDIELSHLKNTASISNIDSFHARLLDSYKSVEKTLIEKVKELGGTEHVCDQFFTNIWGCNERCPFCKEPCCVASHDQGHMCFQHSIIGFQGNLQDKALVLKNCNYLVGASKQKFTKDDATHKYSGYKKYYQDWTIEPATSKTPSHYWQWFLVTFEKQLEAKYKCKSPNIKPIWRKITLEKAIESLPVVESTAL